MKDERLLSKNGRQDQFFEAPDVLARLTLTPDLTTDLRCCL